MLTTAGKSTVLRMPSLNDKPRLSLMDKWRNHYYGRGQDEETTKLTDRAASIYFWFISVTELYCMLCYVIPFTFSDFGESVTYYMKVMACFVFVNATANWACVRLYSSSLEQSEDKPELKKTLWDDHPQNAKNSNGYHSNGLHALQSLEANPLRWKRCPICQLDTPPRCHHCKICKKCILKRDHHCYMTGVCIGYYNERYFVILNFFTAIASFVGLPFILNYMYYTFLPNTSSWVDLVLPLTIYRCFIGTYHVRYVFMVCHLYTLWWTGLMAVAFFSWQMYVITRGKTSHELTKNSRIRCTASVATNLKDVFGDFWLLNFIFPAQILFRQRGDGAQWDNLKRF